MANLTSQNIAVAKLYTALFNRAPDASGFAFWVQAVNNGASLASLTQTVLSSPEALAIYPASQTNAQFVTAFYTTVFGRSPDPEGLAFWSAALQTNGGAGSTAARAALVGQITELVSTPLATQPAGLSDAAYAQTVADRAMFANKIEFGVYFATEVKSNDLSLAKSTLALVTDKLLSMVSATKLALGIVDPVTTSPAEPALNLTSTDTPANIISKLAAWRGSNVTVNATGMAALQLAEVAVGISQIAVSGITGDLALSSAQNDAQLTTLLGAKTAASANVQVNASGMNTATFIVVSEGIAKVDGVSNLSLVLANINGAGSQVAVAGNLLSKAVGATVVATGSTAAQIAVLSTYAANIATDGITGTLALPNDLTATQFASLLGTKTSAAANVVVDATNIVDSTKLGALVTGIGKVDAINNLSLDLALVADGVSVVLLDKAGTGTRASMTGASAAEIDKVVNKIASFAAGGLSGAVTLTPTQLSTASGPALNPKLASEFALTVLGDAADDVINLRALTQGVTVAGGAGVDTISLSGGADKVILGTQAETRSQPILATDNDTAKIDKINNFERADKVQLSTAENAYGTGITFSNATGLASSLAASFVPALSTNDPLSTYADIFAQLNAAGGFGISQTASTSALAQVVYIYGSSGSLKGGYLVINDDNPVFNESDTIISLSGSLLVGNLSEVSAVYKDMFVFG